MEAVILAGGLGTRLRPAVPDLPKALAPVGGRPFVQWLLRDLARCGFELAVLSVGYRHEDIRTTLGTSFADLAIRYAIEPEPLGTGGAVRLAARECRAGEIFVMNGDSYVELDYRSMLAAHRAAGCSLTIAAAEVPDTARFGGLLTKGDRLVGFNEKGSAGAGRINAGVYVMARELLETLALPAAFSFEREILEKRWMALEPRVYPVSGGFIDIGVPEDYARAQALFASRRLR